MFLYLIHQVMNSLSYTKDWAESKKNCLTLMIGLYLHFFFFLSLEYLLKRGSFLAELLRRFYGVFLFIDCFIMCCVYKSYWGRSIINEIDQNEDIWKLDKKNKYHRRDNVYFKEKMRDMEKRKMEVIPEIVGKYNKKEVKDLYKKYLMYKGLNY